MKITKEHMQKYIGENSDLISVKKQAPGITVLKYKPKVFYKSLWTPELCELRGTVVDDDFDIIQRPFTKIFNFGEKQAPAIHRDERVQAVTKVNGFMAACTFYKGQLFISTTGSINSDFVDLAKKRLKSLELEKMISDYTHIFEITDPSDPHIIDEEHGAWLIGVREKSWEADQCAFSEDDLDIIAKEIGALRPKHYIFKSFQDLKNEVKTVNHEGFIVRTIDGRELKIKSPYYLISKFFGRKTEEKLSKMLDNPESTKQSIDEEYYLLIDYLVYNRDKFIALSEQERFKFVREFFERELLK